MGVTQLVVLLDEAQGFFAWSLTLASTALALALNMSER
jgi:hypothetical protein